LREIAYARMDKVDPNSGWFFVGIGQIVAEIWLALLPNIDEAGANSAMEEV